MRDAIAAVSAKFDECLIKDRAALRRKLDKIVEREAKSQPIDKLEAEFVAMFEKSSQLVTERTAAVGKIDYPDLPISQKREEIAALIEKHQVVVIAGETGSGKTTQLPKICMELGLGRFGLIGHTQPRRLAARTVATRIADELKTEVGQMVGYQVRFTDQVSDASQIKLMTDGILLAESQHDPLFSRYQTLIIDEAHERSLNIDFLLGYLKRILLKRPDLKLIITSATIDLERFSKHFNDAPVIEVSGRTYPVEVLYRPLLSEDAQEEQQDRTQQEGILDAVEEIIQLDKGKTQGPRDILVFLSGEREIRETAERLRKAALKDTEIMPLYARLSVAEQNRIFQGKRDAGRRVVLATNVAETSVTVPNIRYVIDTGVARISRYSYRSKVQRLPIELISQASANQRAGRCGRIAPGTCIRLYSEDDFQQRPEFTDAEIRRTNLAAVILQMLNLRLGDIAQFPFIDPPDRRYINDGFKLLEELGAVTTQRKMTSLGKKLSKLPVDPRIARMIVEAEHQGALHEVLIIASALSVQDPRERPADKKQAADQRHKEYEHEDSDFMTMVNLWNLYEEQRQELSQNQLRKFCTKHFLSFMRMREWRDTHRQLHISCKQLSMADNKEPATYQAVHTALLAGLLSHMGFKQENKEFLGARNRRFHIFPASSQFKKPPKWVMAAELVETSKLYARMVARIDPVWAEPLAKHLVKRSYIEPRWNKKRAQVVATEQVSLFGLLIVPKRNINYGRIDPEVAHEIFIRCALVEGDFHTRGPFFKHNRQLLEHVELLEAKSRRRDLLVDEEALFGFYHQKFAELDGSHIVNGAGFEQWRQKVEADAPKVLFLTKSDILQRSDTHVSKGAYPDTLPHRGVQLKLSYHFDPAAPDDGVSVHVPVALLKQLPMMRLPWLVPGMLRDKCEALLRGLPKQLRKNFVPVPDYANAVAEAMVFADGDLFEAMAHQLLRIGGVRIDPNALRDVALDGHYLFNLKLVDAKGKVIAQSRDWEALCAEYGHLADEEIKSAPGDQWGRKGLTRWDFEDLEEKIQIKQAGGLYVDAWPMLVDRGDSVELTVAMSPDLAAKETVQGICRLMILSANSQVRAAKSSLKALNQNLLFVSKVYTKKQLEDDLVIAAIKRIACLDKQMVRSQSAFNAALAAVKRDLVDTVKEVAALSFEVHRSYHEVQKALNKQVGFDSVTILGDIKQQVQRLVYKGYLAHISWQNLKEYPRYMKAVEIRLEKYPRELTQQRHFSEQLQSYMSRYEQRAESLLKLGQWDERLDSFRWYLEEYRVHLFAQQLGTAEVVSDKRVKQRWNQLQSD
ncbi:ATP-dependent RNA helicase HrpA [Neptunomonas sp. XY-337]|uniref:ATP-dependent RNA helicase HrpA n=1 Tax=Neptunomonas sp. XY-337 TaxID=2561897 RepID=UPI0010A9BF03|nr:ATP-dependent RNA helicase HrpA [Neptunomonas sp. XY-337]